MHDPLVVAFEIRRPWPSRSNFGRKPGVRWSFGKHRHDCTDRCEHKPDDVRKFPWWKPSSWSPFWTLAGRGYYFPSLMTIWHREPGGHNSGTVCPHFVRWRGPGGEWRMRSLPGWRFHVHHWKIQLPPLQELRRRLLTRCCWCGGRSTKRNPVNVSHQWDRARGERWWRGEQGLWHAGCSSASNVIDRCVCEVPLVEDHNGGYGTCTTCGKHYTTEAAWIGTRRAVEIAGMPVEGQPWRWPREVNCHEIERRLQAERQHLEPA
jgi:hypothetical protein